MSVYIDGWRVHLDGQSLPAFLDQVRAVMDPVRDDLDAALYAEILAAIFDRRFLHGSPYNEGLRADAAREFDRQVSQSKPGTVFHDPHSFTLFLSRQPDTVYVLLSCQRDAYRAAWAALPQVEEYDYSNGSDNYKGRGITTAAWHQRRTDWQFLIDAARLGDVMDRWDLRDSHTPNRGHVFRDDVILAHLPTKTARAADEATSRAFAEKFGTQGFGEPGGPGIRDVLQVTQSKRRSELAAEIAATLPDITLADLTQGA